MDIISRIADIASLIIIPVFWYIITIERRISRIEGKLKVYGQQFFHTEDHQPSS